MLCLGFWPVQVLTRLLVGRYGLLGKLSRISVHVVKEGANDLVKQVMSAHCQTLRVITPTPGVFYLFLLRSGGAPCTSTVKV